MIKTKIIFTFLYVIVHNGNSYPKVKDGSLLLSEPNNCEASVITRYCHIKQDKNNISAVLWRRSDCVKQWKRRRRTSQYSVYETEDKTDDIINSGNTTEMKQNDPQSTITSHSWKESDTPLILKFKTVWPVKLWKKYGLFTDDYLLLINRHWLKFAPPDPAANYGLGALYILMAVIGCFGNGLVLILYLRCSTLRTPGNILVANLALSDFLMLAKTPIFIFNSFNLGPALGKNGCVTYGFIGGMTGVTSIATLAAIALDRYWAVVRPLEPLRALTAVRARLLAVGAWLYAALFASVPALDIGYGRYVPEGYLTSCSFDYLTEEDPPRYFIFVFFCAGWVAPFCTISFCYLNIFRVVVCNRNVSAKNQDQRLSTRHVKEQTKRKAEIKLAVLVIGVIALFFISWTPYAVVALLGIFGQKELITPLASMIPALFCKTAACVNPFVYIITHPKFRGEFKKMLFRRTSRRSDGTFKTTGYTTEMSKIHRASRDLSDTDVEIVEMKDIPYQCETGSQKKAIKVSTVSSRVSEREGSQKSQRSVSMKSFEESLVSPPSWYVKPKFTNKKRSFRRHSSKSTISVNTDPIII